MNKQVIILSQHNRKGYGKEEIRREEFTNFIEARKRFTDLIRIHAVSTSYMAIEWEEKHAEGGATVRGEFMINPVND